MLYCLILIVKGFHWCIKWTSQQYGFSHCQLFLRQNADSKACCCSCWRRGLGCKKGELTSAEGWEGEDSKTSRHLRHPFFSCIPASSSRRQKTDLLDFQSQLYLLPSFCCSHCSSRWPFPTPSSYFLESVTYFPSMVGENIAVKHIQKS